MMNNHHLIEIEIKWEIFIFFNKKKKKNIMKWVKQLLLFFCGSCVSFCEIKEVLGAYEENKN